MTATRTPHRYRARLGARAALAGAAASLVGLAGCHIGAKAQPTSSGPARCQPAASARCGKVAAPAPGVISELDAAALVDRYVKINNEANAKASPMLNDQIETGSLRAQSQAEYKMYPIWSAAQRKDVLGSFTYLKPQFFIPAKPPAGQQPWFAVLMAGETRGKAKPVSWTSYAVFTKSLTGAWRMAAEATIDKGQKIPTVARDAQGLAKALDPDTTGLALRPAMLPLAVTDNYLTGGLGDGAIFATTPDTTRQRQAFKDRATYLRPYAHSEFTGINNPYYADIYALATTDGGALVIASSAHGEHDQAAGPGTYMTLDQHDGTRAWITGDHVDDMTIDFTCLDAAAIPRSGRVRLLGSDCEETGAS